MAPREDGLTREERRKVETSGEEGDERGWEKRRFQDCGD